MKRILVADDEVMVTTELEDLLPSIGYEVVGCAFSGEEAVQMAADLMPDLILMDIVFPGGRDGICAAEEIRKRHDIPVIFLTGYCTENLLQRARATNPMAYILKPLNERQIKASVEMALFAKDMERRLREAHDTLEQKVAERTEELLKANEQLKEEVEARKQAEAALKEREEDLQETNTALRVLLNQRNEDRLDLEKRLYSNVESVIRPHLHKLKKTPLGPDQRNQLLEIEKGLDELVSSFASEIRSGAEDLTATEIAVARLVREGKSNDEIAGLLGISKNTVLTHRKRIRAKLRLTHTKKNLKTHLQRIG